MRPANVLVLLASTLLMGACSSDATSSNQAVRDAISDGGVDPSSELTYEHFFYFGDETGVRSAESELVAAGFAVEVSPPADGFPDWSLVASKRESLSPDELDVVTQSMEELASRYGGTYDGWGTPIGA